MRREKEEVVGMLEEVLMVNNKNGCGCVINWQQQCKYVRKVWV